MTEHHARPAARGGERAFVLREPDRAELLDVNRTELRLWHWGDATAAPVLLLHGAYDHGRMFDDLAPRIAALGYHAIALDFRGHGDSGPLDTGFAWALLHIDLALLVRDIIGSAVGVIAHSFGAGQAIGLAGAFPELVRNRNRACLPTPGRGRGPKDASTRSRSIGCGCCRRRASTKP